MTPHQRILLTLQHKETDRIPVDIWLTPEVLSDLKQTVGVSDELKLYQELKLDKIVWVFPGYQSEKYDPNESDGKDPWGVPMKKVISGKATYMEFGSPPLGDMEETSELDDYPFWPDPDKFNYESAYLAASKARTYQFATIGPWISFFEIYCHMRGMENALMDIIAEPDFLSATLDRIESIQTHMLERYLNELGDLIDIIFISDDMGTQESQLIAVEAWLEHFKPRMQRWTNLIHKHGKKVLFHTDGAARPFIPHLIDSGIDVLNPIQHICPGMEREALKRDFGHKIVFHGGIENQHVLPYGTVDEVRNETETCLRTLGHDGGYIACSCHNVQAGSPVKNVLTMIETVQNWYL